MIRIPQALLVMVVFAVLLWFAVIESPNAYPVVAGRALVRCPRCTTRVVATVSSSSSVHGNARAAPGLGLGRSRCGRSTRLAG